MKSFWKAIFRIYFWCIFHCIRIYLRWNTKVINLINLAIAKMIYECYEMKNSVWLKLFVIEIMKKKLSKQIFLGIIISKLTFKVFRKTKYKKYFVIMLKNNNDKRINMYICPIYNFKRFFCIRVNYFKC